MFMKLEYVKIHKFKCIEEEQEFEVDENLTVLVGMNESGKTSILEAIAKTNYFEESERFKFNRTHDYPRKEKKTLDKSGEDPIAVTCRYGIEKDTLDKIEAELGPKTFSKKSITVSKRYSNTQTWEGVVADTSAFLDYKLNELGIFSKTLKDKLNHTNSKQELDSVISEYTEETLVGNLKKLGKYFENKWNWQSDAISEYIARVFLKPMLPKFLYYDEYYALPSRISIEKLTSGNLDEDELKTAKALFELADINTSEILKADNFENFIAELEATEATITEELFKYWSTNRNLDISFQIDKIQGTHPHGGQRIIEHILDIRVRNKRARVSLPLRNRSKGFNWFFSFLVWFLKIQEDKDSRYILLLDEPGLNLHASAQADLLRFLEDLSAKYQILYTTHSPFMIESNKLVRVRTVLETENGSKVSDSIQEKDPKTLFPLQAALGYDIAQNLFISKHNLLVEGVSDLVYLQIISSILESEGRTALLPHITIVPTGGLDKVATFISLLRGQKLNIACLLDTFIDRKSKAKVDDMVKGKLIKSDRIFFFDEFIEDRSKADLEDLFSPVDYIKIFNLAFPEYEDIRAEQLMGEIEGIIPKINSHLGLERFNHYRPASYIAGLGANASYFEAFSLDNFEKVIKKVNKVLT
jgi:predicted ATPase